MVVVYTLVGVLLKALLILVFALHRQSWHKVGVLDLYLLLQTVGIGTMVLIAAAFFMNPTLGVPRSIPLIEALVAIALLCGTRLATRLAYEQRAKRQAHPDGKAQRVLIVGAGHAGTMIARELLRHPESALSPIGFLDDESRKRLERFLGLPVLGSIDDLPDVVEVHRINQVLIAMPSAPGEVIRRVVELARQVEVTIDPSRECTRSLAATS